MMAGKSRNSGAVIKIILASSSPYRKHLLQRLNIPFTCMAAEIDESRLPEESPRQQVMRLAAAKAGEIAGLEKEALIIGSDQLALLKNEVLGKPGNHKKAVQQLQRMSGQCVQFLTALCLLNSTTGNSQVDCITYDVYFRELSNDKIDRYLKAEEPYNCAGSFKSEALGITLIERMIGPDPTALIGLPLIKLVDMLNNENYNIP